mmetsp:Transcript_28618/g.51757  ORF Transcript_28618/g.51757 Transcript_28618/m.51757 type:complete len:243 (-) Transcript_28618:144-872(-)
MFVIITMIIIPNASIVYFLLHILPLLHVTLLSIITSSPLITTAPHQHTPTNPPKHETPQPALLFRNILRLLALGKFLLIFGPLFPLCQFAFVRTRYEFFLPLVLQVGILRGLFLDDRAFVDDFMFLITPLGRLKEAGNVAGLDFGLWFVLLCVGFGGCRSRCVLLLLPRGKRIIFRIIIIHGRVHCRGRHGSLRSLSQGRLFCGNVAIDGTPCGRWAGRRRSIIVVIVATVGIVAVVVTKAG